MWIKKDAFDVAVDGPLDGAIKVAPLSLRFGSLRVLYILYSAERTESLIKSIDKVHMWVKERERGAGLIKSVIYCLSDTIFFSKYIQGRPGIKKIGLFQRKYFMDGTLVKNSNTKMSAISLLPVLIK